MRNEVGCVQVESVGVVQICLTACLKSLSEESDALVACTPKPWHLARQTKLSKDIPVSLTCQSEVVSK